MARKAAKKAKKRASAKRAATGVRPKKVPALKKPRVSNAPKMGAFLKSHDEYYVVLVGSDRKFPTGLGLTKVVRDAVEKMATGAWEVLTRSKGSAKVVTVAFASKADFDAVCLKWKASPTKSQLPGVKAAASVRI